jgi:hypothetical protein
MLSYFEVFEMQLCDKRGQGQFQGLLVGVGEAAELFGIQPQFPGHLDVA